MISMDEEPKLAKGIKLFCSPQHPTWPGFISWRSEGADVPDPQDPTILKEGFFSLGFKNKFAGLPEPSDTKLVKGLLKKSVLQEEP